MDVSGYVGTPYSELNCWGLVREIYAKHLNLALAPLPVQTTEKNNWIEIPRGEERVGDLVLFRISALKRHVGIVIGGGLMIHSDENLGVVIERYKRDLWKSTLQSIYRHK